MLMCAPCPSSLVRTRRYVQIGHKIYLKAIKHISAGQELLTWYGKHTTAIVAPTNSADTPVTWDSEQQKWKVCHNERTCGYEYYATKVCACVCGTCSGAVVVLVATVMRAAVTLAFVFVVLSLYACALHELSQWLHDDAGIHLCEHSFFVLVLVLTERSFQALALEMYNTVLTAQPLAAKEWVAQTGTTAAGASSCRIVQAKDNETLNQIAARHKLSPELLLTMNKPRITGLTSISTKFKQGTGIVVPFNSSDLSASPRGSNGTVPALTCTAVSPAQEAQRQCGTPQPTPPPANELHVGSDSDSDGSSLPDPSEWNPTHNKNMPTTPSKSVVTADDEECIDVGVDGDGDQGNPDAVLHFTSLRRANNYFGVQEGNHARHNVKLKHASQTKQPLHGYYVCIYTPANARAGCCRQLSAVFAKQLKDLPKHPQTHTIPRTVLKRAPEGHESARAPLRALKSSCRPDMLDGLTMKLLFPSSANVSAPRPERKTPDIQLFDDSEYRFVRKNLEAEQQDGTWLPCEVLVHNCRDYAVLWYGGEEYEGLCCSYVFDEGTSVMRDGDGNEIPMRRTTADVPAHVANKKMPTTPSKSVVTADDEECIDVGVDGDGDQGNPDAVLHFTSLRRANNYFGVQEGNHARHNVKLKHASQTKQPLHGYYVCIYTPANARAGCCRQLSAVFAKQLKDLPKHPQTHTIPRTVLKRAPEGHESARAPLRALKSSCRPDMLDGLTMKLLFPSSANVSAPRPERKTPDIQLFDDSEYRFVRKNLEAEQQDGTWLPCEVLVHNCRDYAVLWYGGEEYEGLCCSYVFDEGTSVMRDGDGNEIHMRRTTADVPAHVATNVPENSTVDAGKTAPAPPAVDGIHAREVSKHAAPKKMIRTSGDSKRMLHLGRGASFAVKGITSVR